MSVIVVCNSGKEISICHHNVHFVFMTLNATSDGQTPTLFVSCNFNICKEIDCGLSLPFQACRQMPTLTPPIVIPSISATYGVFSVPIKDINHLLPDGKRHYVYLDGRILTCLWKLIVQVSVVLTKTVGGSDSTNSLSQDYTNLDDQLPQTCHDSPRFKPFTLWKNLLKRKTYGKVAPSPSEYFSKIMFFSH